jgi:hypothetical protein
MTARFCRVDRRRRRLLNQRSVGDGEFPRFGGQVREGLRDDPMNN